MAILETSHRPWPLPGGSWVMRMSWHDLLFAHWPVPAEAVGALVPSPLQIDTFERRAWVGVIPFRMTGVTPRWVPPLPGLSAFPELNVRTYVTLGGKPGVWFFSLDAANLLAVHTARWAYALPYFHARMSLEEKDGWVQYRSRRLAQDTEFKARYRPTGKVFHPQRGTLEYFLTERYCLYAIDTRGRLRRAEIHHPPWPLQPGEALFERNTMAAACGIALPDSAPLLHFARRLDVLVWPLRATN